MLTSSGTKQCLLCFEKKNNMIVPLNETLNECDTLTLGKVLQNLHFPDISNAKKIDPQVLCYNCLSHVQSCYDLKIRCDRIEKEFETVTVGPNIKQIEDISTSISVMQDYSVIKSEISIVEGIFFDTNKETSTDEELVGHLKQHSSSPKESIVIDRETNMLFVCDVCDKQYPTVNGLKEHNEIWHNGKYVCHVCNKSFVNYNILNFHKAIHVKQKYYVCDVCSKPFDTEQQLVSHKAGHSNQYLCDVCGKSFNRPYLLKSHKCIKTYNINDKRFACDVCNKSYSRRINLNKHKEMHSNVSPYRCNYCQITFTDATRWRKHRLDHRRNKSHYVCNVCDQLFINIRGLRKHQFHHNVNSARKPYVCDVCFQSFDVFENLVGHKKTHAPKKVHVCDVCTTAFYKEENLVKHKIIHVDGIRYVCDVCQQPFPSPTLLKAHKLVHLNTSV